MNSEHTELRRLRLRVAAKLMVVFAALVTLYVVLSVFLSSDDSTRVMPTQRVDTSRLQPGQSVSVLWEGRPVLIYRRTVEQIAALQRATVPADAPESQPSGPQSSIQQSSIAATRALLADPDSNRSRQPDWAKTEHRSRQLEWFVSIGVGTDFSCPVNYLPASEELFKRVVWQGGFIDSCRGSRYDVAGRVFAGQYAVKNLIIPPYSVSGNSIVLGG